jgi:predicted polyphosphate/ATP-dependent NAD kinase
MKRIGFLINPIAGMGGRVGLKGTDGVVERAVALGASPIAPSKAQETLEVLRQDLQQATNLALIRWVTCSGAMGADVLKKTGFADFELAYATPNRTTVADTKAAARQFLKAGIDLILFCGGDGTARDIAQIVQRETPVLGIPSGVKMYSGVFGTTAARTAEILLGFVEGRLTLADVDILDLDEERYRQGEWAVKLFYAACTPYEATYTQAAKMLIDVSTDADIKDEIADYLCDEIEANSETVFLLGPGSTVRAIGERLGIDKTLLGIDAVAKGRLVGRDLNERDILDLLDRYPRGKLILSPIGAQGFILGRGNLQLSATVIERIGSHNIIVVATPAKLARTPMLRFDTGDAILDDELTGRGYVAVVIGYRLRRLVRTVS